MSELEELLKQHVADVGKALGEFAGKIETVDQAVKAVTKYAEDLELRSNRYNLGGGGGPLTADELTSRRTDGMLTKGLVIPQDERDAIASMLRGNFRPEDAKGMQISSEPDGGYLVPDQTSTEIERLIRLQSPMRRVARVIPLPTGRTLLPVNKGGTTSGWVGEGETRDETDTSTIGAIAPPGGTIYALPKATEEVVEDAIVNLEQLIQDDVVDVMAEDESKAFIAGNGMKKPLGFIEDGANAPTATADGSRAFGNLQYIASGAASTLGTTPTDKLVSMIFAVKAGYRQAPGTAWLASSAMLAELGKLKDGEGRPLYLPSLREGVPGLLIGYPTVEFEHMDAIGAGAFPLAFGNWQRGYVIGDRTQLSILRDPYTTKGQIKWYFRRRVHGMVNNSEAIKLLKVAAS